MAYAYFSGKIPLFKGSFMGNLVLSGKLPLIRTSTGFTGFQRYNVVSGKLPFLLGSLHGKTGEIGSFKGKIPFLKTSGFNGLAHAIGTFSGRLSYFKGEFTGLSGSIGSFSGALPLILTPSSFIDNRNRTGSFSIVFPVLLGTFHGDIIPVTYNRKAIVMHLFSHAVSEYKNYNFNSLAHFNGVFLGANEKGLYPLGGDDDLGIPIQAFIRSGVIDFVMKSIRNLPKEAWVAYRSKGQMEFIVEEDEHNCYRHILDEQAIGIAEVRPGGKSLGKGYKGRFYRFTFKNLGGSDFDLESIRVLGQPIKRKVR
jgi:hypothetical protein